MSHLTYPRGEQGQIHVRNPGAALPQQEAGAFEESSTWTQQPGKALFVKGRSRAMAPKRLPQNAHYRPQSRGPGGDLMPRIFKYQVGRMKVLG